MGYEAGMKADEMDVCATTGAPERVTIQKMAVDALETLHLINAKLASIGNFLFGSDWHETDTPPVNCLEQNLSEIARVSCVCEKMAEEIKFSIGA